MRTEIKNISFIIKNVLKLIWEISPKYLILLIILLITAALIPIGEAYLIKRIIDELTRALSIKVEFSSILFFVILLIFLNFFKRLITFQKDFVTSTLKLLFNKGVAQKIVKKATALEFWQFEHPEFHDKLDRVMEQATWRPFSMFYDFLNALSSLFFVVSTTIALLVFSPIIVVLMILFSLPSLFVQIKYGWLWHNLIWQETPESRRLNYYQYLLSRSLEMKDIKLLNLKDYLFNKYKVLFDKLSQEQKSLFFSRHLWEFLTYLFSDLIFILFYIFLAWQAFAQKITIGDFAFFSKLYGQAVEEIYKVFVETGYIYENSLFVRELFDFFALGEEKRPIAAIAPPKKIEKGFTFKNVWFKYPGTKNWVLKDISFTIPVKTSVALVGENGSGKTTIVKLLLGLYAPEKGEILLDGVPINRFDPIAYRKLFGVAFQDYAKFFFTVDENIRIGDIDREISKQEIIEMAKKVQLHKKILSLPKKYKTLLGRWFHEGYQISEGEWQRLAIARALIREAPVYVLDEPTAALDAKAEYQLFNEFKKLVRGKIAIFISHRFSNVKLADWIIVIDKGRVVQQGRHKELLAKPGLYRDLYFFQSKRYQE